ncbi:hypothetical protein, partial [Nocardioides sp. Soil805]|uniref:hypothetical protein n=1 Tax=Nocardioides sp. Soil805 TaxID=1736416 RepID=UPI000702563A
MNPTAQSMVTRGVALAVLSAGLSAGLAAPVNAAHGGESASFSIVERAGTSAGTIVYISGYNVWIARGDGTGARALTTDGRGTSAGTIVYISGYNVWIARGDGTGARALTTDGSFAAPYGSPTQSDGGVVVATHSERLVRMTQSGRVLNVLDPPALPTSVGVAIDGTPVDAAISPDGTRIAYTFTKYLTPSGASSGFRSATGYTSADRLTDPVPLRTTYFWSPSWVGSSRTLQSGGYGSQVQIHDLGAEPVHWFDDGDIYVPSTDVGNTELSRDGRYLAAVRGYDETATVFWYAVNGNAISGAAPADPTPLCEIGPLTGITNPTWGPDSDSLAWQEPDGIWTRAGAGDCTVPSSLILPGGSEPHWSSAPLSAP